uniref:Ig-like domain-containing protein n=1 Tax=Sus scrofa TaxID=9823 RepID=A0A8D1AWJ3_PIG
SGGRLFLPWHVGVCFPGSSPVTGPKAVRGQERGSLAVQCRYTPGWESHGKWWCRGADWGNCKILVQTTASEPEVKRDRVSIRDDRENRTFTVTTEELRLDDAGVYWCGIERVGHDHVSRSSGTLDAEAQLPCLPCGSSLRLQIQQVIICVFFFCFYCFWSSNFCVCLFRAIPMAYGRSQTRG